MTMPLPERVDHDDPLRHWVHEETEASQKLTDALAADLREFQRKCVEHAEEIAETNSLFYYKMIMSLNARRYGHLEEYREALRTASYNFTVRVGK